jgi:hypothetical protein
MIQEKWVLAKGGKKVTAKTVADLKEAGNSEIIARDHRRAAEVKLDVRQAQENPAGMRARLNFFCYSVCAYSKKPCVCFEAQTGDRQRCGQNK